MKFFILDIRRLKLKQSVNNLYIFLEAMMDFFQKDYEISFT